MNYTENAVSAKVHALFAKRLTENDYNALLSFHSIEEILNYLRNETAYSSSLGSLPSVSLSHSRLENALQKSLLDKKASLCRFQKLIGDETYKYFIKRDEIDTILYCARHLDTMVINDLFERPPIYKSEQSISGTELQKAMSFDEFSSLLSPTPYGKTVESLFASGHSYKSLAALERILYNNLYSETKEIINRKYKGRTRREILEYIEFLSDMYIVSSLYRLLDNYPEDKNYKTGIFAPSVTAFTKKELRAIEAANSPDDILSVLKGSVYGKYFNSKITSIDFFIRRLIIEKSIKNIHHSQNPVLVLFSYETVLKNEINNIIQIIEGVKYGLSPDEISKIIVKGENVCL